MPDLVAQHAGKLRLVVEVRHDAAGEIHKTTRHGKCIDHRRIHNFEFVAQIRPVRYCRQSLLAFFIDKLLKCSVFVQAHAGYDFRSDCTPRAFS